jgi:hypothetical protein
MHEIVDGEHVDAIGDPDRESTKTRRGEQPPALVFVEDANTRFRRVPGLDFVI